MSWIELYYVAARASIYLIVLAVILLYEVLLNDLWAQHVYFFYLEWTVMHNNVTTTCDYLRFWLIAIVTQKIMYFTRKDTFYTMDLNQGYTDQILGQSVILGWYGKFQGWHLRNKL